MVALVVAVIVVTVPFLSLEHAIMSVVVHGNTAQGLKGR